MVRAVIQPVTCYVDVCRSDRDHALMSLYLAFFFSVLWLVFHIMNNSQSVHFLGWIYGDRVRRFMYQHRYRNFKTKSVNFNWRMHIFLWIQYLLKIILRAVAGKCFKKLIRKTKIRLSNKLFFQRPLLWSICETNILSCIQNALITKVNIS